MDPSPATFFGREHEIAALGRILRSGHPRVIGVTGPAGVGKSRLVQQVIINHASLFDEVCFLTLKQLKPTQAAFAAAAAGGLLVLDGLDDAPDGPDTWTKMIPGLPAARIILTARKLPHLPGMLRLRLEGLPFPPEDQKTGLACNASVALFLAAVRQANPGYEPSVMDLERVAAYCRNAAGLPGDIIRTARSLVPHPL